MEVRNCKGCNRLFQYLSGVVLCPACKDKLEDKFTEVKEYIYKNPGASITEVSEANDVSTKQIKQWIREDRLILSSPTPDGVLCEQCGTPICSGRYCASCKSKITANLNSVIKKPKETKWEPEKRDRDGDKMRFIKK